MKNKLRKQLVDDILGLMLLNVTQGTAAGMFAIVVPLYALALKASTVEIGLIKGVLGIGVLLFVLPVGFLVEWFGSRRLYLTGNFSNVVLMLFMPVINTPKLLLAIMLLKGIAGSFSFTSLNAVFLTNLPGMGMAKAGWFKGSMSLGLAFIGPFLGSLAVGAFGFGATFMLIGVIWGAPGLAVVLLTRHSVKKEAGFDIGVYFRSFAPELKKIFSRTLAQGAFAEALNTSIFAVFSTFAVVLVLRELRLKPIFASSMLAAEGIAFMLMVFIGGSFLSNFGRKVSYPIGSVLVAIAMVLIANTSLPLVLLGAAVLTGSGLGILNVLSVRQVSLAVGDKGKIAGVHSLSSGGGATLGPALGGFIGAMFGLRSIFLALIPGLVLFTAYVLFTAEEKTETAPLSRQREIVDAAN